MKRPALLYLSVASLALSSFAAMADTFSNDVVAQLTRQGFSGIKTETTWLGRTRIVASRADGTREIVVNPRSGEILRDLWTAADGVKIAAPVLDDVGETTGTSTGGTSTGGASTGGASTGGTSTGGTSPGGTSPGGTGSNGSGSGSDDGAGHDASGSPSGGGDDKGEGH